MSAEAPHAHAQEHSHSAYGNAPGNAHGNAHGAPGPDDPILWHQYNDLGQQSLSATLSMWVFLATEVMFFSGLFLAFALYRSLYHKEFFEAAQWLNVPLGGINTVVLLTSSLTMAFAVRAAQLRRRKEAVQLLVATMILGAGFLGIKAVEWYHDYEEKLIPGINFEWHGPPHAREAAVADAEAKAETATEDAAGHYGHLDAAPASGGVSTPGLVGLSTDPGFNQEESRSPTAQRAQLFFVLYFFMTGLHAIHMIIGLAVVAVIAYLTWTGWISGTGSTHIEVVGLYWHFIDIIWVFLYPILYLIERNL